MRFRSPAHSYYLSKLNTKTVSIYRYTGDGSNAEATCVENTCDAFAFTVGMIGDVSNDNACSDGIILSAVIDSSCDLTCDEGYMSTSSVAHDRYEGEDNTYAFTRISEIIMEGDFVHAVDMGGPGDVTVGDAHFTACNPSNRESGSNFVVCPGDENVYIKAAYLINPWGSCSDCTEDTNMNQVLGSILWTPYSMSFDVQIEELNPNFEYELQLFFVEQCCDRGFYIYVDGELQADINPKRLAGSGEPTVFIHSVTPSSTTLSISLWGNDEDGIRMSGNGGDQNPILQALTLRRISSTTLTSDEVTCRVGGGVPEYDLTCTEMTCDDADCGEHASCDDYLRIGFVCSCDNGYTGDVVSNGAATCVENACDAFEFTEGVIGDTSGDDACSDNIVLTAVNDNSCDLTCDEGYKSSGTAKVTCSLDGGSPESDFTCTEMTCDDADCGDHAQCNEGGSGDGYFCECLDGFDGSNVYNGEATCSQSPCYTNPPVEHAEFSPTCMNTDGSHGECTFTCSAGYEHVTYKAYCNLGEWDDVDDCTEIDECAVYEPCENDATCEDEVNGYSCHCDADHYGTHCAETHDDCSGDETELCGYGTCNNLERTEEDVAAYSCTCDDGWSQYEGEEECTSENTCDAFAFTEGVIGDASNNDACSDNIVLTAVNDNSCDLTCASGYKSSGM